MAVVGVPFEAEEGGGGDCDVGGCAGRSGDDASCEGRTGGRTEDNGTTLKAQHAVAQSTIRCLEGKVEPLEGLLRQQL